MFYLSTFAFGSLLAFRTDGTLKSLSTEIALVSFISLGGSRADKLAQRDLSLDEQVAAVVGNLRLSAEQAPTHVQTSDGQQFGSRVIEAGRYRAHGPASVLPLDARRKRTRIIVTIGPVGRFNQILRIAGAAVEMPFKVLVAPAGAARQCDQLPHGHLVAHRPFETAASETVVHVDRLLAVVRYHSRS